VYDESLLIEDFVEVPVQVNGKLRATIQVSADANEKEIANIAERDERVRKWLEGKHLVKTIAIRGKLVNFVVR